MDVSIVVVNWNTRDFLRDCLMSVCEQTKDITFEVIVVDNASADGSTAMVKAEFPQLTLVEPAGGTYCS
jgi:GT2 family glycosyltransferase